MKVRHTLICFFLLSLQDGNNGLLLYTGTEGRDIRVKCSSSSSGSRKILCKDPCEQEDIIIETTDDRAQKGRFSIEWSWRRDVSVTITQLTKSDSGLYGCGSASSYQPFEILVVDALLDGDSSEETTFNPRPGGNILVRCSFPTTGIRQYFCKGGCDEEDILVATTGYRAQRGRYSIIYAEESKSRGLVYVGITQLTRSDSGRYRCALDKPLSPDSYRGFSIVVTDAPTASEPTQAMTSSVPSASTATTTQSLSSSSGSSRASSASPATSEQSDTARGTYVLLSLGLALVVMVILSLSVLLFCRRRTSKPTEPAVETQYADVSEANRVYEDMREDGRSRSPAVEISDDYNLITAGNLQNTAEGDSSGLTYSQVTFSSRAAGSSSSGVRGDDNVVYSVPRVETLRDENELYSTVHGELRG